MIYHYCDKTAFNSIIANKQVWLTDIAKLNDRSEYKSGFDLILEVLKKMGLADRPVLQDIHTDKLNNNFRILVGCFSKEGDVGSQWGLYADNSRGLSIGFNEAEIDQFNMLNRFTENDFQPITSHVKLCDVHYDSLAFIEKITNLIERMEQSNAILKDQQMAIALRRFAALYKDPYFKDERETRAMVVIESDRDEKYALNERVNAWKEKASYHKLLTSYQNLSAIKEVIIGANCTYTLEDVKRILHEHGLDGVTVRYSSGRERHRIAS